MSDLGGYPDYWFSHATAQISCDKVIKDADQPVHRSSLIRSFAMSLSGNLKLFCEQC